MCMVFVFGLPSEQTGYSEKEKAQKDPYGIKHDSGHEHIEDGGPKFGKRGAIVGDGIDVQSYGYQEADEQREELSADAAGGDIEVWHFFE